MEYAFDVNFGLGKGSEFVKYKSRVLRPVLAVIARFALLKLAENNVVSSVRFIVCKVSRSFSSGKVTNRLTR